MKKYSFRGEWRKCHSVLGTILYTLSVCCLLFTSCGTAKKVTLPSASVNPIEEEIETHIVNDDINALLSDCAVHPEYADLIRKYILYERDYSRTGYSALLSYRDRVSNDSVLYCGFDAKVRAAENRVYDHVHDMPLAYLIHYYKSNREYQPFLKAYVEEGLKKEIPSMEYKELRATRMSLMGCDFEGMADNAYFVARKSTEPSVKKSISDFSKEEKSAISILQTYINDSLTVYTAHAFQSVLRKVAAKDLPSERSAIDDLVQSSLNASFTSDGLQSISRSFLQDYQDRINKARAAYYQQLTGNPLPASATLDLIKVLPKAQMGKLGGLTPLYDLAKTQNDVSLKSGLLSVAGFLLSGGLGLLASAAGSYHEAKEKAEKKKEYLNQFSKNFLPAMMGKKDQYFASLKKSVNAEITKSQKAFLDAVYENY